MDEYVEVPDVRGKTLLSPSINVFGARDFYAEFEWLGNVKLVNI